MTYKISVIIAAYHGERFIAEQLRSLFAQTRTPDEILIGDDSENDATHMSIESVRHEYAGSLCYIRNPQRRGFVRNFLNLANLASGDIIFFCDQDDVWLPTKIEILSNALLAEPGRELVACNSELVDATLHSFHMTMISSRDKLLLDKMGGKDHAMVLLAFLQGKIGFSGHNMAMKRSCLRLFNLIPHSCRAHDIWLEQTTCFLKSLHYVDQVLTLYRIHGNNVTNPVDQLIPSRRNYVTKILDALMRLSVPAHDVLDLNRQVDDFVSFANSCPTECLDDRIRDFANYISWRAELLTMSRFRRWCAMGHSGAKLKHYFSLGRGWKSLIRDIFASAEASSP